VLHKRRLIAFICLVALVLAALTPAASIPHYAILVPLDPLFGLVVIGPAIAVAQSDPYRFPLLEITGSRPPPTL
jgi:hypothetical protein